MPVAFAVSLAQGEGGGVKKGRKEWKESERERWTLCFLVDLGSRRGRDPEVRDPHRPVWLSLLDGVGAQVWGLLRQEGRAKENGHGPGEYGPGESVMERGVSEGYSRVRTL